MGPETPFAARAEARNGVARIALSGELDMATVPSLLEPRTRFEQNGVTAIMLDLREVTFLDMSGLNALLRARDRASTNGHRLVLVGASRPARRLLELTGTQLLFDEQDAISVVDRFTGASPSSRQ